METYVDLENVTELLHSVHVLENVHVDGTLANDPIPCHVRNRHVSLNQSFAG